MTYQDFQHDARPRNEGRDDNHAGKWRAFIVSRFRKDVCKTIETYVSKQSATAGMNEIETSRFSEEKDGDDGRRRRNRYKTASTTPIKRDTMRDKNDEEEEENCLNEVEKTRKNIFAFCERGGSAPREEQSNRRDNKDDQQKRWAFETAHETRLDEHTLKSY